MKKTIIVLVFLIYCSYSNAITWIEQGNYDISWYDDISNKFEIQTPAQLAGVAFLCNTGKTFANKEISIVEDIDMGEYEWVTIKSFRGVLNGNGNEILNLHCQFNNERLYTRHYISFINKLESQAVIKNIGLEKVNFKVELKDSYDEIMMAGLVCENYGIISDCIVNGDIISAYTGCGLVFDPNYVGGIVAYNYGYVKDSSHNGLVQSSGELCTDDMEIYAGGIVAFNEGYILNCINYGEVNSDVAAYNNEGSVAYSGGIAGASNGFINNVINFANITAKPISKENVFSDYESYASGITNLGECSQGFNCSSSIITAINVINSGLLVSLKQFKEEIILDLLNKKVEESEVNGLSFWAQALSYNDGIPFVLNNFAMEVKIMDVTQNSATFICSPTDISSSVIINKGFDYKKINDNSYQRVYTPNEFSYNTNILKDSECYIVRSFIIIKGGDEIYSNEIEFKTPSIFVETKEATNIETTSATLKGGAYIGSDRIKSQGFLWKAESDTEYNIVYSKGNDLEYILDGLSPSTRYTYRTFVLTENDDNLYGDLVTFSTLPLEIYNEDVIVEQNSITIFGKINIDITTNVVIEYKGTTGDTYNKIEVKSLSNGTFECQIFNLLPNTVYEIRTYFSYNGKYIYSKKYVYTTLNIQVHTYLPLVEGFVTMRGSIVGVGDVFILGFEYRNASLPNIIESYYIYTDSNETDFSAKVTTLSNGVEYKYRAFYEDKNGNKTFGNWVYFTPENMSTNIQDILNEKEKEIETLYDINGLRLKNIQKGINIIKYTDKTFEKIMIR